MALVWVLGAALWHRKQQPLSIGSLAAGVVGDRTLLGGVPGLLHGALAGYQLMDHVEAEHVGRLRVAAGGDLAPGAVHQDAAVEHGHQVGLLGRDAVVDVLGEEVGVGRGPVMNHYVAGQLGPLPGAVAVPEQPGRGGLIRRAVLGQHLPGDVLLGLGPAIDDLLHVGTLDGQGCLAFSLVLAFEGVADSLGDRPQGRLEPLGSRELLWLWLLVAGHIPHSLSGTHPAWARARRSEVGSWWRGRTGSWGRPGWRPHPPRPPSAPPAPHRPKRATA